MSTSKYIALIPAYKPETFLLELVHRLKECGISVVLVDDGSGFEYENLFLECNRYAEVLHHNQNSGKGCALKTGLDYICTHFPLDSIIVTVDADGQHRVEDAIAVCSMAEKNPNTLVLGSRKLKGNVPLRSQIGNTVTRFIYRLTTGLSIYDTQTGLRAFSGALIPKLLEVSGERYEYEMNVLLKFAKEQIPMMEYEIETVYLDNNASSHFNAVKDSVRIYKEILKFSASSLISFFVDYIVYSLLLLWGCGLTGANVFARMISASVNYTLNRRMVFKSKENLFVSACKYTALAVGVLVGNTAVLHLLVNTCGIHWMLAKIVTEFMFFVLNWMVQRLLVFRKKAEGDMK